MHRPLSRTWRRAGWYAPDNRFLRGVSTHPTLSVQSSNNMTTVIRTLDKCRLGVLWTAREDLAGEDCLAKKHLSFAFFRHRNLPRSLHSGMSTSRYTRNRFHHGFDIRAQIFSISAVFSVRAIGGKLEVSLSS